MLKECLGARFRATTGVHERLWSDRGGKKGDRERERMRREGGFGEGVLSGEEAEESRGA